MKRPVLIKLRNQNGESYLKKVSDCQVLKQACSVWKLSVKYMFIRCVIYCYTLC
jgi:hypothetical protein